MICLTCRQCNNRASRIDHQAFLGEKAREEWAAGQGIRLEVGIGGVKKAGRYLPSDSNPPFPTQLSHLPKGSMKIGALPTTDHLDASKGIQLRIPRSPHYEWVSMIKTAFLLVFSLMGEGGYKFAASAALQPVREQILKPSEKVLKGCFVGQGTVPGTTEPRRQLVFFCHGARPPAWLVPLWNGKVVLLPCGGPEPIDEFVAAEDEVTIENNQLAGWASCRFNESVRITGTVSQESGIADGTLVGSTGRIPTDRGEWEWMIVNHHKGQYVALPLRPADDPQNSDTLDVVEMLGIDAVAGRGLDKSGLTRLNLAEWSRDLTILGKPDKPPRVADDRTSRSEKTKREKQ